MWSIFSELRSLLQMWKGEGRDEGTKKKRRRRRVFTFASLVFIHSFLLRHTFLTTLLLAFFFSYPHSGCLSTGLAPDLSFPNGIIGESIEPQHEPLSSYYFLQFPRPLDALELHDWDSVETMLGMSRGLVELLHRVRLLLLFTSPFNLQASSLTRLLRLVCLQINSLYFVSRPSGVPGPGEPPLPVDPLWISQANVLLVEVATWRARVLQRTASLPDGIQISRVDMGNLIYTHMFEVRLFFPSSSRSIDPSTKLPTRSSSSFPGHSLHRPSRLLSLPSRRPTRSSGDPSLARTSDEPRPRPRVSWRPLLLPSSLGLRN